MQDKPDNTISKVLMILIVTLSALAVMIYFSFRSYQNFSKALSNLNEPPIDIELTEDIQRDLISLETLARKYLLTSDEKDLANYIIGVKLTKSSIDSLYELSIGKAYHNELDSLRYYYRIRVESYNTLLEIKAEADRRNAENEAQDLLEKTQQQITLSSKTEVSKEDEVDTSTQEHQKSEKKRPNWFRSIFSKKNKEGDENQEVVSKEVGQNQDSSYALKVDTLLSNLSVELQKAESEQKLHAAQLTSTELRLVNYDEVLVNKLQSIVSKIKEIERVVNKEEKTKAVALARKSFSLVSLFAFAIAFISVLLISLVIRDVWRSRRLRKELESARLRAEKLANVKEEFLANMSHEIRTPLNSILGFSEQMSVNELQVEQQKRLQIIMNSGEHLLMLVNDILDYSKIESGKLRIEKIGFSVSTVLTESIGMLEAMAQAKGIGLNQTISESVDNLLVNGDPIRLKQILLNLIGNGIKFTDAGHVEVQVDSRSNTSELVDVIIAIRDTGKGIDASEIDRIFDEFDQEDTSISRKYGGSGLGLSICKKLVELQGGSINVYSELGKGSEFIVNLRYPISSLDEYNKKFDFKQVELNLKEKSLLLIDDDQMNHTLLKPSLDRWGLLFDSAFTADQGLERLEEKSYDFILVDLQMPGKSGAEVIKEVAKSKKHSNSKLILCTANALVDSFEPKLVKMVDATLLKPFRELEVAAMLAGHSTGNLVSYSSQKVNDKEPLYSLENFKAYAGGDDNVLVQFLDSFIQTNNESLKLLSEYLSQKDYTNVGDTAHKMKNTFGQLKARLVLEQLVELEKLVSVQLPVTDVEARVYKTIFLSNELFELIEEDIARIKESTQTSSP